MAEDEGSSMGNKVDHQSDQPSKLSHKFIKHITNDFDEALIVGSGGFGTVYKGVCESGEVMAVKVLRNMSFDCKEFQKEYDNLERLKHQNVVQLKGFCNESEEHVVVHEMRQVIAEKIHTALCFEFVGNGSLTNHITADGCSGLNWHTQYKIIKGICDGLEYLREGLLKFSVWHLDLKPDNILLDENMIPKITDFGLSRLLGDENTRNTINMQGTWGYMPPEYIEHGSITKQFDIFSLGVIIVKLMAGHEAYSNFDGKSNGRFARNVHGNWRKKLCESETLTARQLEVYCEQVKTCIQIALQCINRDRTKRPTIKEIVSKLEETERMINDPGLRTEQLILPKGGIGATPADMVVDSRGKTEEGKEDTASTKWNIVSLQSLKNITSDFKDERRLCHEVFGIVYKGILEDGEVIAVTKLEENLPMPPGKSFINEVKNIMALKHDNLVELVGFSCENESRLVKFDGRYITADITESLLCYEYLPKGNLMKNLLEVPSKMDWETRFKIIKGVCQGLLFLHSIPIVHMNLKLEKILLDNDMRPKIVDPGLSRLFGQERVRLHTHTVVRSYGYIAPEYLYRGEISTKSDIYSLGLIIIETIIGERNSSEGQQPVPSARKFIDTVRETWTSEHIALVYSSSSMQHLQQVKACIEIGLQCTEIDRHKRPSIETIVDTLNKLSQIDSNNLLSLQPRRINFPIEPKRLTSRSLYLTNSRDDRIAFRLETKFRRRYLPKLLPLCGIVPPKCTYILTVITLEKGKTPMSNHDDSLTLQSSIAHHEDLERDDPASVALFLDTAGDAVQEEKVELACEPLAETISNCQIIDGRTYREVLSVDVHPTEPWILTSNKSGDVCIWNYQTQEEVNSFEVTREPVYSAKFIEREGWFIVGTGDGCIFVYDYNTMEEVHEIEEAHNDHGIMCLAVNPSHSFVLSASDDHKIKLWDWTNEWQCTRTFEGHNDTVTEVMFNPRNSESFASASLDHTVKVWDNNSGTCIVTYDGHPDGLLCVHYHPRYFQQFLVSGASDGAAKIWDLDTDSCVDTLQGHAKGVSALCWHPERRVLVTGSLDGAVRLWNWNSTSSTYRLETIIGFNLSAVNALGYLKGLPRIVVGCDQGIALMEINVM